MKTITPKAHPLTAIVILLLLALAPAALVGVGCSVLDSDVRDGSARGGLGDAHADDEDERREGDDEEGLEDEDDAVHVVSLTLWADTETGRPGGLPV